MNEKESQLFIGKINTLRQRYSFVNLFIFVGVT